MSDHKLRKGREDAVRLLRQLSIDSFELRSFDRTPQDAADGPDFGSSESVVPVSPSPAPPSSGAVTPKPAAAEPAPLRPEPGLQAPLARPVPDSADPAIGEVFGRLLRQGSAHDGRRPSFRLALKTPSHSGAKASAGITRRTDPVLRELLGRLDSAVVQK